MNSQHRNNRQFAEAWIQRLDPSYRQRWDVYDGILKRLTGPDVRWLDCGCGINEAVTEFPCSLNVGIDRYRHPGLITSSKAHFVMADIDSLPFDDGLFDLVTLNTVVEHLAEPERSISEIYRVLRPGGHMLIHTTNCKSPLIMMGNLFPQSFRVKLMNAAFGGHEPDIFPTFHRLNTANLIASLPGFTIEELFLIQDLNWSRRFVFAGLMTYHLLSKYTGLHDLRTNIVALLRKTGN